MQCFHIFASDGSTHAFRTDAFNRNGSMREALYTRAPAAAQIVLDSREAASDLPVDASAALRHELARLLPWLPAAAIRREAAASAYVQYYGAALAIEAWDDACSDAAATAADALLAHLRATRPQHSWDCAREDLTLAVTRSIGTTYYLRHLRVDADDVPPAELADRLGQLTYQGLIAAALRTAAPLALLERLPALRDAGFHVERAPHLRCIQDGRTGTKAYYTNGLLALDLDIHGAWRIGGGVLFGYGDVRPNAARDQRGWRPPALRHAA